MPLRHRLVPSLTRTAVDDAIERVPRDALVLSSRPDIVYLLDKRSAVALPARRVFTTGQPNHDYDKQLAELARIMNVRGGYLDWRSGYDEVATPQELGRLMALRLVARGARGQQLYEISPAQR
jgi:hypothetical protein